MRDGSAGLRRGAAVPGSTTLKAAAFLVCLAFGSSAAVHGQQTTAKDLPDGPAPTVSATESAGGPASFAASADEPAATPNHPPIHLIPPKPMPFPLDDDAAASASSGPGKGVRYDPSTGETAEWPVELSTVLGVDDVAAGGGYAGADGGGGSEELPAAMSGNMSLIAAATRALHPWRMSVKVVMRFGASYFVCSGTMRDMRTVLTAGHCINDGNGGAWADEVWVYPGWDGVGTINPAPSTTTNPYGWARHVQLGSWTSWTINGDFNFDIGIIALDRAVGALTGWFGWAYGGSCSFWQGTTVNSASYPGENCSATLHTGRDMYYWSGTFDSCPGNRLQLTTSGGCLGAIWGGQSGGGAYYIPSTDTRWVHAVTSTSNRSTSAHYVRQWEDWVNWNNDTFIPTWGRGASFDLQPLDVNAGPASIVAGSSTTLLNHLAVNATNGAANNTWTFDVYLSTNDNIETTDTLLSTQSYDWNFGALGSVTVNMVPVTIPGNVTAGTYWLGVIYRNATDGNISNNDTDGWDAARITVTKPNLDITLVSVPASAQPGTVINVSNTVANIGSGAAGSFRVGIYLSTDTTCTTGDVFLTSRLVSSLGVGFSNNAVTPATIPANTGLGLRHVCAIADYLLQVPETNESDNTGSAPINIVRPDLSVTLVNAPSLASPGGVVNVSNTIFNGGTAAAGAFRVGLYLSSDAVCTTADTFLASRLIAGLGVSASNNASTPVTIPAATTLATHNICVIADDLGAVTESNETNNTGSRAINIVPARPVITLKVNGMEATPPAVVTTTGPFRLTLSVSPTTYTAPVNWYWVLILNGTVYYRTPTGFSTTAAPWFTSPPVVANDVVLVNATLPAGTNITNAIVMLDAANALVAYDVITADVIP